MASSKQAKRFVKQGKKILDSTTNKRTQSVVENDDSQDEAIQPMTSSSSGRLQKPVRPNAFLSFRITNQQIIENARELQKQIIASNPLLSKASVEIPTLHITLLVFALKTDEDKQRARQSLLDVCQQVLAAKLPSPQITFTGLSHFNNKVLYIDPVKDIHLDTLTRIAEICRETYERNGIMTTDTRPFNPHLTLFKLSKARDLHRKGVKKIDTCWTTNYADHHFGIENLQALHLCNMLKKQTDGYYEIFHEENLFNPPSAIDFTSATSGLVELETVIPSIEHVEHEQEVIEDDLAPLLQQDRRTYEEPFTGFASFFPYSRSGHRTCCSIV